MHIIGLTLKRLEKHVCSAVLVLFRGSFFESTCIFDMRGMHSHCNCLLGKRPLLLLLQHNLGCLVTFLISCRSLRNLKRLICPSKGLHGQGIGTCCQGVKLCITETNCARSGAATEGPLRSHANPQIPLHSARTGKAILARFFTQFRFHEFLILFIHTS